MVSPGSLDAPTVAPAEPRRGARLVVGLAVLAALVGILVYVGGRGWEGPHSLTATGTPTDSFDRMIGAGGLGQTDDGRTWQTPVGPWAVDGGRAHPIDATPLPVGWFAVVPTDSPNGLVGVTTAMPQDSAGVVFRFQDPQNYWSYTASPSTFSSVVRLILRGLVAREQVVPGRVPTSGSQIEVRFDGNWIDVRLDGNRVVGLYDPNLSSATSVGLVAGGLVAPNARFDDFYALSDD